jgi:hypothetical protein
MLFDCLMRMSSDAELRLVDDGLTKNGPTRSTQPSAVIRHTAWADLIDWGGPQVQRHELMVDLAHGGRKAVASARATW